MVQGLNAGIMMEEDADLGICPTDVQNWLYYFDRNWQVSAFIKFLKMNFVSNY